jgi:hypothetical protein
MKNFLLTMGSRVIRRQGKTLFHEIKNTYIKCILNGLGNKRNLEKW